MPQNISQDRVNAEGIARITPSDAERLSRYLVKPGDIVYSRRGDVERRALITERENGWLCGTGCLRVRLGEGVVDPVYASYFLSHPASREWVVRHAVGATMPNLNTSILEALPFLLPPASEQRAIAAVLGALDDKIEQNRRTARALERLARAIFRAWFVDFEPVKAKAEGATTFPSMPQTVFDTLPTRFVDTAIGPVPGDWGQPELVAELERREVLLIGDGYRAKRSELSDQGLPFIRAKNVDDAVITDGAELLGDEAIAKAGTKRSQVWDTVFTSKGTVGRLGLVTPGTGDVVYAPQVCFWRAVDWKKLSPFFLYLWMRSELFTKQWMAVKGETDMADFVSLSDQRAMNFSLPPLQVQRAFDQMVQPLIELRSNFECESRKLAETRDLLLPKLLSGQLRVEAVHG